MFRPSSIVCILVIILSDACANHFRGGIISWRPIDRTSNGPLIPIQIHQRYFWNRDWSSFSYQCTEADVIGKTSIPVSSYVTCYTGCSSSNYWPAGISTITISTDCDRNSLIKSWSGEFYQVLNLTNTTSITIGFADNAWFGPNLFLAAGKYWSLMNRINLERRPDGLINSSPVTTTLPVLFKTVGQPLVHVIQMADNDGTDILRCRWSNPNSSINYNRADECADACWGLRGFSTLHENNCTLQFTLPLNHSGFYHVVALQIEDYFNATSTTPMSSVPIQFLIYGYTPSGSCTTPPVIIGERPNRACIGTPIGTTLTEKVIAQVVCGGTNVTNFVTSSPIGMQHSDIDNQGNGVFVMTLTWTPEANQEGPQGFCAAAVDNNNLQSDAWCVTYLVNYTSPHLVETKMVQGTASPVGTIFSNHSIFSIQATRDVHRPTRNFTFVQFVDASNNSTVQLFDAGWSPNLLYTANTIVIITNYTWTPGATYYVFFDSGVASGIEFCGPESKAITDPHFWRFNIWDPGQSSTTTTTTTPPTTATVTTRPILTTTANPLLTTTGIQITTPTTITTTTTTSAATMTTTSSTSGTVNVATTDTTEMSIFDQKDFEEACKLPITAMIAISSVIMMCVHGLAMFAFFVKMDKLFNPNHVSSALRDQQRLKRFL